MSAWPDSQSDHLSGNGPVSPRDESDRYRAASHEWLIAEHQRLVARHVDVRFGGREFTVEDDLRLACTRLALDMRHLERGEGTIGDEHLIARLRTAAINNGTITAEGDPSMKNFWYRWQNHHLGYAIIALLLLVLVVLGVAWYQHTRRDYWASKGLEEQTRFQMHMRCMADAKCNPMKVVPVPLDPNQ